MHTCNHRSTQILKVANGWLVILPEEATGENHLENKLSGFLKKVSGMQMGGGDEVMDKIMRENRSDDQAETAKANLKDIIHTNMHIFKDMEGVAAFLKTKSGE